MYDVSVLIRKWAERSERESEKIEVCGITVDARAIMTSKIARKSTSLYISEYTSESEVTDYYLTFATLLSYILINFSIFFSVF